MKQAEINHAISEWFEPEPTEDPVSESDGTDFWEVHYVNSQQPGISVLDWLPPNYFADEAANAHLLEAMPLPMLFKSAQNGNWICRPDFRVVAWSPEDADRKTAAVLAFCKFAGIKTGVSA